MQNRSCINAIDISEALKAVSTDGIKLSLFRNVQNNKGIVLDAVKQNGNASEYDTPL